jgi:hypothetical protein
MKKLFALFTAWYLVFWSLLLGHTPVAQAQEEPYTEPKPTEISEFHWTPRALKLYAKQFMNLAYPDWNLSEHRALMKLWGKESAWNHKAQNPTSSAFGVPQLLKLNPNTPAPRQIERGLEYIVHRYEKPSVAWSHWRANGWY